MATGLLNQLGDVNHGIDNFPEFPPVVPLLEIQERGLKHTRFLSFLDDQNQLGAVISQVNVKLNPLPARTQRR